MFRWMSMLAIFIILWVSITLQPFWTRLQAMRNHPVHLDLVVLRNQHRTCQRPAIGNKIPRWTTAIAAGATLVAAAQFFVYVIITVIVVILIEHAFFSQQVDQSFASGTSGLHSIPNDFCKGWETCSDIPLTVGKIQSSGLWTRIYIECAYLK